MNNIKYIVIDIPRATSVFEARNQQGKILGEVILETKPAVMIDCREGKEEHCKSHLRKARMRMGSTTLSNRGWPNLKKMAALPSDPAHARDNGRIKRRLMSSPGSKL
jgi:hypothetical protein